MIYRFHYYPVAGSFDTEVHEVWGCSTKKEAMAKMDAELGWTVLISHTEELTGGDCDDLNGLGGF